MAPNPNLIYTPEESLMLELIRDDDSSTYILYDFAKEKTGGNYLSLQTIARSRDDQDNFVLWQAALDSFLTSAPEISSRIFMEKTLFILCKLRLALMEGNDQRLSNLANMITAMIVKKSPRKNAFNSK